jgi:spore germination cell wall hydrolase CwlJ-like protein
MTVFYRAAGYAAAMLAAVLGTPSLAWEFSTTPVTSSELTISAPAAPHQSVVLPPAPAPQPVDLRPAVEPEAEPDPAPQQPRTLAELVAAHAATQTADREHECLANAVYFESKGESLQGQLSVAEVVLNRARSGRFPKSVCGVVKQRGQFSFVRGGRLPAVPRASAAWKKAVAVAHIARQDLADSPASRALFFHATRVRPGWRGLTRIAQIGNHIFYR